MLDFKDQVGIELAQAPSPKKLLKTFSYKSQIGYSASVWQHIFRYAAVGSIWASYQSVNVLITYFTCFTSIGQPFVGLICCHQPHQQWQQFVSTHCCCSVLCPGNLAPSSSGVVNISCLISYQCSAYIRRYLYFPFFQLSLPQFFFIYERTGQNRK